MSQNHHDILRQFRSVSGVLQKCHEDNVERQKSKHLSMIDRSRNISNIPAAEKSASVTQVHYRRQKLEKWKQEKEKRKKEAAAKKIKPFVTGVVRYPTAFTLPPLLPTKKVKLSTSDRVKESQTLSSRIPKTKTESQRTSFAPVNAQFHPPQTILAQVPIQVWAKDKKGKSSVDEDTDTKISGLVPETESSSEKMKSVTNFRQQLNSEIQRMTELCDAWENYTAEQNVLPETVQELVLGAVGQARLLMSSKLQQFAALVSRCERPEPGAELVTPNDLHGFWDMVYMQIEDVNARYSKLEELRSRGWAEEQPRPSAAAPSRAPGRPRKRPPCAKPRVKLGSPVFRSPGLREIIAANRRAKKQQALSTPAATGGAGGESGAGAAESGALGAGAAESGALGADASSGRSPGRAAPRSPSRLRTEADESATQRRASYEMLRASRFIRDVELEGIEPLQQTPAQITRASLSAQSVRSVPSPELFDEQIPDAAGAGN